MKNSLKSRALACLATLVLGAPLPALPHHSTANFDMKQSKTVTGKVKYFGFTNPHSFIDIEVSDKSGATRAYKVFTMAKVVLLRTDWASDDLKVGDQVTFTGNPDRKNASFLYLRTITFKSGKAWSHEKAIQ